MTVWTHQRVEFLKTLWAEGRSATQIARELGAGITRNAVVGKAHRLGISGRPGASIPGPKRGRPRKEYRPPDRKVELGPKASAPMPARIAESFEPPGESGTITLMALKAGHCRWPFGDGSEEGTTFCGQQQEDGSAYCGEHRSLATRPAGEADKI